MASERLGILMELDEPGDQRSTSRAYANLAMRAVSAMEASSQEAKKAAAAALTASGHAAEARRSAVESASAIAGIRSSLSNIEAHLGMVPGLPTVPLAPAGPVPRAPSQHDIDEVKDQVEDLADDFEAFKKEATNPGIGRMPSDPTETAKKAGVGLVILGWRGFRRTGMVAGSFAVDHWKELAIALMATGHLPWLFKLLGRMPDWAQHLLK